MSELKKAVLKLIDSKGNLGDPIPVQFNPSTLKLQISNQTEGGESRGRQARQYTGSSSTILTMELVFDTADEGTTDQPVSVLTKTSQIEQFVYPRSERKSKQAPPKLHFEWGGLILEGVVQSITIDLEHFAPNGVPLRAKVGLSFKEQDRKYELLSSGPGANKSAGAPAPGQASPGAVGSFGAGFSAQAGLSASAGLGLSAGLSGSASFGGQVGVAIGGESAAEFAARVGVDPGAWRGLSFEAGAGGSLSLEAGAEVGFSADLSANAGVGVFAGANAGASASLEGAFGLKAEAGVIGVAGVGASGQVQQAFSLAAAGGLGAAIESVKIARSEMAVAQTRQAFAVTASAAPPTHSTAGSAPTRSAQPATRPSLPEQKRTPARLAGLPGPGVPSEVAPAPPVADPRATSFGFGVPLRRTFGSASLERSSVLRGRVPLAAKTGQGDVPITQDPTTPPWQALPATGLSLGNAKTAKKSPMSKPPCACAGPTALRPQ